MLNIDLGGLTLNSKTLVNQIRQDLKDDWFKDPLNCEDMLDPEHVKKKLIDNITRNHGVYVPSDSQVFDIPKKNFALRYSIEKNLIDRIFYHGISAFLIPYFDPLFSSRSMSHRLQSERKRKDKYLFKSGVEQWLVFKGIVNSKVKDKVLLETDINSFFENIQTSKIQSKLISLIKDISCDGLEKIKVRRAIDLLFSCLPSWTYEKGLGLPQNRDASSFLANALMDTVDKNMLNLGYDYYRYMDDVKIVCDDQHHARKALMDFIQQLRELGLGVNSQKTKIYENADEIKKILAPDRRIERINLLWNSRRKESVLRSFKEIIDYTFELIDKGETQDRAFRYCVTRITKACSCEELSIESRSLDKLTDQVINQLDSNPVSSDQLLSYLKLIDLTDSQSKKIIKLLCNKKRSIYSWQNYLIWNMFSLKKLNDMDIFRHAWDVILSNDYNQADKAGACLYIGSVGTHSDKIKLSKNFDKLKGYLDKRCALIAIHELSYDEIEDHVPKELEAVPELKGVYKNLNKNSKFTGLYCMPVERISFTSLYDSLGSEHES